MATVIYLRTLYSHWGKHTAYNALSAYSLKFKMPKFNFVVPMGNSWANIQERDRIYQDIKRSDMAVHTVNDHVAERKAHFWASLLCARAIHYLDGEHGPLLLTKDHYASKKLLVATFHQPAHILEKIVDKKAIRRLDRIEIISPAQKEYFDHVCPDSKLYLSHLGVDTKYFVPDPNQRRQGMMKCLAGGIWERDYDSLVRTALLLKERKLDIEYHLVCKPFELPDGLSFIFHTGISDEDLLALYQSADVLFQPMKSATANTFLMEGASCGLPIVSSDMPSLRWYFPGEEAILVPGNDPERFAEAIYSLYSNVGERQRRSQLARSRMLELDWARQLQKWERLYEA